MRMQRQSMGPPASKLQNAEEKRVNLASPEAELAAAAALSSLEDDFKTEKIIRSKSKADRSIHIIPLLTLLCLLILYLCSHDPKDPVASEAFSEIVDLKGISATEMGRFLGKEKAGSAAVGSRRALKEAGRFRHWKMGSS